MYTDTNTEPTPGERYLTITASDYTHSPVSVQLIIDILILNNNPPIISFAGKSAVTYNETAGGNIPLVVGSIMRPIIADADNNNVFNMQGGVVTLGEALDASSEMLGLIEALPAGINSTSKKRFNYYIEA